MTKIRHCDGTIASNLCDNSAYSVIRNSSELKKREGGEVRRGEEAEAILTERERERLSSILLTHFLSSLAPFDRD